MESRLTNAREAGNHLLSWLDATRDEAAVFTFDTQLDEIVPFTVGLKQLPRSLSDVLPFGATSLNDAIAQTAERVGRREGRRRAVAVFTDGNDTASRLKPSEVSAIASAIDVPVYVFGIVPSIDNPASETADEFRDPLIAGRCTRGFGGVDGRAGVHFECPCGAKCRGQADGRRVAASISTGVRIEQQAGLASADRVHPRQEHGCARTKWLQCRAISPEFVLDNRRRIRSCAGYWWRFRF